MRFDELARLDARPATVAEWEDLLIRLEIVPRVVRNELEDAPERPAVVQRLRDLVRTEAEVGALLEAAAGLGGGEAPPAPAQPDDLPSLAHRFASLRARTFAMVQRRGLEVWEWRTAVDAGGEATVYQLLAWLAGHDAAVLRELRDELRAGTGAC